MHKIIVTLFCIISTVWAGESFAQEYYVQSTQAPLWRMPSFAAEKLILIPRGGKVEVLEEQQGWLGVQYKDRNGWMLKLMLAPQPPVDQKVVDQQVMQLMDERSRLRPSAYASTAAARGLMTKEAGFGDKIDTDFEAVAVMESFRASMQDALDFIAKGKADERNK